MVKLLGWATRATCPAASPPSPMPRFIVTRCCANAAWRRAWGVRREISVDWLGQNPALPAPSTIISAKACHGARTSGSSPNPTAWSTSPAASVGRGPTRSITGPARMPAHSCAADELPTTSPAVAAEKWRTSCR